jgi:cytochrome c556
MRNGLRWGVVGAGAAAVLLAGVVAGIAQDKLALVNDRQTFMKAQGADAKAIGEYAKGSGDQAAALKAIDDLLARNPKILAQFPPGTSATDFPGKSNAKPELWTDMDKVKAIPAVLQGEEEKVKAAIQSGDQKAVAAAFGSMGKNGCGACHSTYRVKTT